MGMGYEGKLEGLKKNGGKPEKFQSLIERDYMLILEENPEVRFWTKNHGIQIVYYLLLTRHHYWPDFFVELVDGSKEIHETKGEGLMYWLTTHAKREAAEKWCKEHGYKYRMVTPSKRWFYEQPKERIDR